MEGKDLVVIRRWSVVFVVLLCGAMSAQWSAAQDPPNPAADPDAAKPAARPEIPKSLLGRPEKISGTISMVLPERRLVVLTVPANAVPKFLMVLEDQTTVSKKPEGTVKHHKRVILTQSDEATFDFIVTTGTSITLGGRRFASDSLADLNNRQATVRFVPRSNGNIAQLIEVQE